MLDAAGRAAVPDLVRRGLLERAGERLVLTRDGRLLADAVVRDLLPWTPLVEEGGTPVSKPVRWFRDGC